MAVNHSHLLQWERGVSQAESRGQSEGSQRAPDVRESGDNVEEVPQPVIMWWGSAMLVTCSDLRVLHRGTMAAVWLQDENLRVAD